MIICIICIVFVGSKFQELFSLASPASRRRFGLKSSMGANSSEGRAPELIRSPVMAPVPMKPQIAGSLHLTSFIYNIIKYH